MVANRVDDRGGTGRLRLDVGPTTGGYVPVISCHSIQQPGGGTERGEEGERVDGEGRRRRGRG